MTTLYSPFTGWLPQAAGITYNRVAEIIQLEFYRYLLARTDKLGFVRSEDGIVDLAKTDAALHLRYMTQRFTNRFLIKVLAELVEEIRPLFDLRNKKKTASEKPFSLSQFSHFVSIVKLLEFISEEKDVFIAFGSEPRELALSYLPLYRTADGLFSDTEGSSTLTDIRHGVLILQACGVSLNDFDPKLFPAIKKALTALRGPAGGFCDSAVDKVPTLESTFSGVYLTHILTEFDNPITVKSDPEFAAATLAFIDSMRLPTGGYREDALSPSSTLKSVAEAVFTTGMLNLNKYNSLPKKKIISYLDQLDCDDSGSSADEWTQASDLESTLLGLIVRLVLEDDLVVRRVRG